MRARTARPTGTERRGRPSPTLWDWPLRLWHWAFAACIGFSLYSGLDGDIALLEWHRRCGLALLGLLTFRAGWGLWGGRYARWRHYWTTPRAFLRHFRGQANRATAHTAPGVALVSLLMLAAAAQVLTGLFATDDIFNEGPLAALVADEVARQATWIHRRLHWLVLGAVCVHLLAHVVYGAVLRDPTPLAMFTGRKPNTESLPSTSHFWLRAGFTVLLALGVVFAVGSGWFATLTW